MAVPTNHNVSGKCYHLHSLRFTSLGLFFPSPHFHRFGAAARRAGLPVYDYHVSRGTDELRHAVVGMQIVYTLKLFLMGFSPLVSDSVLYTFNIIAETFILQKTRCQATQIGPNSYKDEAKKAV